MQELALKCRFAGAETRKGAKRRAVGSPQRAISLDKSQSCSHSVANYQFQPADRVGRMSSDGDLVPLADLPLPLSFAAFD